MKEIHTEDDLERLSDCFFRDADEGCSNKARFSYFFRQGVLSLSFGVKALIIWIVNLQLASVDQLLHSTSQQVPASRTGVDSGICSRWVIVASGYYVITSLHYNMQLKNDDRPADIPFSFTPLFHLLGHVAM